MNLCQEAKLGHARASSSVAGAPALRAAVATRRREGAAGASSSAAARADVLDFGRAQVAFDSKTTLELLRTWLVFKVCSVGWIVKHCDQLYSISLKVLGAGLTHWVMRHAIFNHFCAGETVTELVPRMRRLQEYGVGGILDYAAEAKDEAPPKAEDMAKGEVGAPLSARTFEYKGEAVCDANAEIFLDAIRAVRDATPDGFAAIKLTGLGDPVLLERMSTCLVEMTELFRRLSGEGRGTSRQSYYCIDRSFHLDSQTFSEGWRRLFKVGDEQELRDIFRKLDADNDGIITFAEWAESLDLLGINELCRSCLEEGPLYKAALNDEEAKLYGNLCRRVQKILDLAQELGVRVMIDAEWLDIQPAIDHLVIFLQRIYNRGDRPVVFQTYQTYLKGMHGSVLRDLERSRREGWYFGAKVVRGAYMVSEREKARERGYESPVCDTYEDTEANFHATIDSILSHNSVGAGTSDSSSAPSGPGTLAEGELLVASHSRGSIEFTLQRMQELEKDRSRVHFGQLLGMADHLTFTLGVNGYKAYKYVPYGPIDEVVPYLIRRTQENSTLLGSPGVQEERRMVSREVRRRLLRF
uniref:Proline dehydrogenase n=1 Tax=Alexandrium catenella TaxID=2925 RepID=A0A7S1QNH5_ALECA